tara:strand:+ start:1860 stop:2174 length:315 start_codon:yes stop_codon:yes gene_type:complete
MKILIDEEYGFKYWLWEVDAEWEDVQDLLDSVVKTEHFYSGNPGLPELFDGTWQEVHWEDWVEMRKARDFDAIGMLHEDHDSWYVHREDVQFQNSYTGETFDDE